MKTVIFLILIGAIYTKSKSTSKCGCNGALQDNHEERHSKNNAYMFENEQEEETEAFNKARSVIDTFNGTTRRSIGNSNIGRIKNVLKTFRNDEDNLNSEENKTTLTYSEEKDKELSQNPKNDAKVLMNQAENIEFNNSASTTEYDLNPVKIPENETEINDTIDEFNFDSVNATESNVIESENKDDAISKSDTNEVRERLVDDLTEYIINIIKENKGEVNIENELRNYIIKNPQFTQLFLDKNDAYFYNEHEKDDDDSIKNEEKNYISDDTPKLTKDNESTNESDADISNNENISPVSKLNGTKIKGLRTFEILGEKLLDKAKDVNILDAETLNQIINSVNKENVNVTELINLLIQHADSIPIDVIIEDGKNGTNINKPRDEDLENSDLGNQALLENKDVNRKQIISIIIASFINENFQFKAEKFEDIIPEIDRNSPKGKGVQIIWAKTTNNETLDSPQSNAVVILVKY